VQLNGDIRKQVDAIKQFVYGDAVPEGKDAAKSSDHGAGAGAPAVDAAAVDLVARALMAEEIMPLALTHLKLLDFETRKDFVALFVYMLRHDAAGFASAYLPAHVTLLYQIMDG